MIYRSKDEYGDHDAKEDDKNEARIDDVLVVAERVHVVDADDKRGVLESGHRGDEQREPGSIVVADTVLHIGTMVIVGQNASIAGATVRRSIRLQTFARVT